MKKMGLEALIAPHKVEDFLEQAWPQEPFVVHGLSSTVRELTEIPFLQSLDALIKSWPNPIQVHLPDVSDESSAIHATAQDARKLFSNRMALLFNNVHTISPVLTEWLQALGRDLGLPTSTVARCMAYATPSGKGTAAHFDQNINFVLQLQGTKKWWIAPNYHVENPTERYTIGQELDPELASYVAGEMPKEMPKDRQEIVLKPGSMLFVPRGFWHSTEAEGEALALNFTFSQPTWIDLLVLALRSRLSLSPEWRELADGVTSKDSERRLLAQQTFDILLQDLVQDLPNWRAEDILAATEGSQ
ncbi:MAG: JmjC domain-containing protein [Pseudobdellovibrionaceae bacterium]